MITASIQRNVHQHLVSLLNEPVEYGGTLKYNKETLSFDLASWRRGMFYDEVDIPVGIVQWHTHPRNCSPSRCTLGIPSGPDLAGFARAATSGKCLAHLIYSKDGIYAILMDPRYLHAMKRDANFAHQFGSLSQKNFNSINEHFANRKDLNYARFKTQWLETANRSGFKIRLFPLTEPPCFRLDSRCVRL